VKTNVHGNAERPQYSGAGVLVAEQHAGAGRSALLVFRNADTGKYDCAGGKTHTKDVDDGTVAKPSWTAAAELREESRNMLCVTSQVLDTLPYVDMPAGRTLYRTFILCAQNGFNFDLDVFDSSKKTMDANEEWRETDGVARLCVRQFAVDNAKQPPASDLLTFDVDGRQICLNKRDRQAIALAVS